MKKKIKIVLGILFLIVAVIFIIGRFVPETSEDMLLYEGKGAEETVVDLAIQGSSNILYLRKIKLIGDEPTVGDIIQAVNLSDEGINIVLNENGEIVRINDYLAAKTEHWNVLVDNEDAENANVWKIPVNNYQGITFILL